MPQGTEIFVSSTQRYARVLPGLVRFAREQGWRLRFDSLYGGEPALAQGDAVVLVGPCAPSLWAACLATGKPIVGFDGDFPEGGTLTKVELDSWQVGALAAEHLFKRRYQRFVWLPLEDEREGGDRGRAFAATLRVYGVAGLERVPPLLPALNDADAARGREAAIRALLDRSPRSLGVFAANEWVATEWIRTCEALGVMVPAEVGVVTVEDGWPLAGCSPIEVSTIHFDWDEAGVDVGRALVRALAAPTGGTVHRIAPKALIPRASSGAFGDGRDRWQAACRYIAENFMNPMLGVQDVAEAVGVSRRSVERLFRQHEGRTVTDYVASLRTQEAARILRSHDRAKVHAVARLVGFSGQTQFYRTFRRVYGVSPKAYGRGTDPALLLGRAS